MMNIPVENTFILQDAKADQLNKYFTWFQDRFEVLTRRLDNFTGVLGLDAHTKGMLWEFLKAYAMKLTVPFDSIIIDLNQEE